MPAFPIGVVVSLEDKLDGDVAYTFGNFWASDCDSRREPVSPGFT